jgi:hypothetical protein
VTPSLCSWYVQVQNTVLFCTCRYHEQWEGVTRSFTVSCTYTTINKEAVSWDLLLYTTMKKSLYHEIYYCIQPWTKRLYYEIFYCINPWTKRLYHEIFYHIKPWIMYIVSLKLIVFCLKPSYHHKHTPETV